MINLKTAERFIRAKLNRHSNYLPHAGVIVILIYLLAPSLQESWDGVTSQISNMKTSVGKMIEEQMKERPTTTSTTTTTMATTTEKKKCNPKLSCIDLPFDILDKLKNGIMHPSIKERTIYLKTSSKLSNILFEMGFVIALSEATCSNVKVNTFMNMNDIFATQPFQEISETEFNNQGQMPAFSGKDGSKVYERLLTTGLQDNMKIQGVFPIYRFFSRCLPKITERLKFNERHITEARSHVKEALRNDGHIDGIRVGVHIHHSDDINEFELIHGMRLPNETYYKKAMTYFKQKYAGSDKHVVFIVVTDDRNFVERHFPHSEYPDVFMVQEDNSLVVNLAILGMCDHVIQSQGTFSQWGAILSKGESISPDAPLLTEWMP